MKLLLIVFMFMASLVYGQDIKVELNPPKPVAGENFSLNFIIPTLGNDEPEISFTPPSSIEVLGRSNEGVSIQSVLMNGKITMKREVMYSYEMRADNVGYYRIKDIYVEVGKKKNKIPDISVTVVKEKEKAKDVFMLAQVSKTKLYVCEGFDVGYYLYYKVPVFKVETTDFPKLNHFTKRFHDPKLNEESINYNGEVFRRSLIYQARLYPQKAGKLYVDSLRLVAKIKSLNQWGFAPTEVREKNVYSLPVEVEVLALPTTNVPKDFTGLVGDHDFKISVNKEKFLTNEVIELKLHVQGPGALESYDGPKIYQDSNLEEFEVKSELQETSQTQARKNFDYTYLTRGATQIPSRKLSFSYFDPNSVSFKTKLVEVPGISVTGNAAPSNGQTVNPSTPEKQDEPAQSKPQITEPKKTGILAPVFSDNGLEKKYFWKNNWIIILNFILILAFVGFGSLTFLQKKKVKSEDALAVQYVSEVKSKGINYARLHKLLSLLRRQNSDDDDATLNRLVDESNLSQEAHDYFKNLINQCEHMGYNSEEIPVNYVFEKKYFKELVSLISQRRSV